ncbi:hypothetical protein HERIO_339 [Hepatospora eriocheir]|uniref:Uncharacterized protein n=1 Tax=Hepatospora eriocheir TaxID=1081669 RepID=A0A1X0QDS1_9MICR|nr:hypothetical protein HERIO_339 [Hepatospora eriocheir]
MLQRIYKFLVGYSGLLITTKTLYSMYQTYKEKVCKVEDSSSDYKLVEFKQKDENKHSKYENDFYNLSEEDIVRIRYFKVTYKIWKFDERTPVGYSKDSIRQKLITNNSKFDHSICVSKIQ